MNDDLISRQAAIKALEKAGEVNYLATGEFHGIINALNVIKGLPTAEPRKGKWIPLSDGWAECSSCEHLERVGGLMCRYCPNCGCRMTEESDEEADASD